MGDTREWPNSNMYRARVTKVTKRRRYERSPIPQPSTECVRTCRERPDASASPPIRCFQSQLATIFRAAGYAETADAVLYAARSRELDNDWRTGGCLYGLGLALLRGKCWHAAGLGLLKITVGYGIGSGSFLALAWVAGFTVVGGLVLWPSQHARQRGALWCLGASLDRLLPIIGLNKGSAPLFEPNNQRKISLLRKYQSRDREQL